MKLYSDFAQRRTLQIVGDVVALVVLVVGILTAVWIYQAIVALQAVGRDMAQSGSGFAATMSDVGDDLSGVPLIGDGIRAPFDAASRAGDTLAGAGESWQSGVAALAGLVGWTVAGIVVLVVVLGWIGPRIVGAVRRARLASLAASPTSVDLLALRALARRPAHLIARLDADAVAAWRRGDRDVIRRLAALELKASGVRLDAAA